MGGSFAKDISAPEQDASRLPEILIKGIANLSEEIIHQILSFLPLGEFFNVSLTSKEWNKITQSDQLWSQICEMLRIETSELSRPDISMKTLCLQYLCRSYWHQPIEVSNWDGPIVMKVGIIGEYQIGKRALLRRAAVDMFTENYTHVVGPDFCTLKVSVPTTPLASDVRYRRCLQLHFDSLIRRPPLAKPPSRKAPMSPHRHFHTLSEEKQQQLLDFVYNPNVKAKLRVWDTHGSERYRPLPPLFYRGMVGCILAYDVCSLESFKKLNGWLNESTKHVSAAELVVVGTKRDLLPTVIPSNNQRVYDDAYLEALASETGQYNTNSTVVDRALVCAWVDYQNRQMRAKLKPINITFLGEVSAKEPAVGDSIDHIFEFLAGAVLWRAKLCNQFSLSE